MKPASQRHQKGPGRAVTCLEACLWSTLQLLQRWSPGSLKERLPGGQRALLGDMRQLKGKPKKETSKDKKERKLAMQEARQQVATVVLPTLVVLVLLIVVFVYVATRPDAIE
ncbi:Single-pass membrane and coiled-coil domain-containing protein 4 [Oryzias melastigma]|uniref:Single-pass membrane and coiled-coil domain-containing protein 4 n=2 Tax=Oryzias melastigma TaxID=30732 RepID=A0A834KX15_ORYME|nr:Single-pass membrane and coiled-coil domain-containing protein 4 [Oryzias melastigma]